MTGVARAGPTLIRSIVWLALDWQLLYLKAAVDQEIQTYDLLLYLCAWPSKVSKPYIKPWFFWYPAELHLSVNPI